MYPQSSPTTPYDRLKHQNVFIRLINTKSGRLLLIVSVLVLSLFGIWFASAHTGVDPVSVSTTVRRETQEPMGASKGNHSDAERHSSKSTSDSKNIDTKKTALTASESGAQNLSGGSSTTGSSSNGTSSGSPGSAPSSTTCAKSSYYVADGRDAFGTCYPGPSNTGVASTVALTNYMGPTDIYDDNITIDGKIINGILRVGGHNFTIKNSILYGVITQIDDPSFPSPSYTVIDSTINSKGDQYANYKSLVGSNITVLRSDISGAGSGGMCNNCILQDNWIHGQWIPSTSTSHMSGYRMSRYTTLRHNTISCDFDPTGLDPEAGCSAALTGYGDFEPVEHNTIDKNLFVSNAQSKAYFCAYGGSTAGKPYSSQANNIVFSNNVFQRGSTGKCGRADGYAITDYDSSRPGNQWLNNRWDDGTAVAIIR